jgi:hypothetical protein
MPGHNYDDFPFTVGQDKVHAAGALYDDTSTDSVDEGDIGIVRMSSDRKLLVSASVASGGVASGAVAAGAIVVSSFTSVTGTKAASGDNTLISAPGASTCIVLVHYHLQNESATATTLILKDGSTEFSRFFGQNQGDGIAVTYPDTRRKKLTANTALVLNLSGANTCGYTVDYYTEAA